MDISLLLNQAIDEVQYLNCGEEFELKDLYKGYEWNRIEQGAKSTLGTLFLSYANSNENIKIIKRGSRVKRYVIIQRTLSDL